MENSNNNNILHSFSVCLCIQATEAENSWKFRLIHPFGRYLQRHWLNSDQQKNLGCSQFRRYQKHLFPNVTLIPRELNWDGAFPLCPPREMMLAAGNGAVKGKGGFRHMQALWSGATRQEGNLPRSYWNCERLFIFPHRRKRGGGGGSGVGYNLLKNVFQAFIATGHSYSNSGIPWMWFSTGCCLELWGTDLWRLLPVESAVAGATVRHLDIQSLVGLATLVLFVPLSQTLPRGCSNRLSSR